MARLSLQPTDVTFSSSTMPRIECELSLGSEFAGMTVTLVVYDAALYSNSPAARAEAELAEGDDRKLALPGFMASKFTLDAVNPPPGNTGTAANPDVKAGTGVLFAVEGVLTRAKNEKWFLNVTTSPKEVTDPQSAIELFMRDDKGRMSHMGVVGYFAEDLSFARESTLLFRLAETETAGGGNVIAASLGAQGGGATNPYAVAHAATQATDSSSTIGGTPAEKKFPPAKAVSRALKLDLTGFYDSIDAATVLRPICVEINQAGRRIAGWVTDVPRGFPTEITDLSGKGLLKIAAAPRISNGRVSLEFPPVVVFSGDINAGSDSSQPPSWPFTWWSPVDLPAPGPDPDREPLELPIQGMDAGVVGRGRLSIAPGSSLSEDNPSLSIRFDTSFGSYGPWTLVRSRRESRWPTALIDDLPGFCPAGTMKPDSVTAAQDYLRATQVRPLPLIFWSFVQETFSADNAELMDALSAWIGSTGAPRSAARTRISNQIERIFVVSGAGYERVICDGARAIASATTPPQDGGSRNLLEWFEVVVGDEWSQLESAMPGKPDQDLLARMDPGFRLLQIRPGGRFQYTLTFHQANASGQFVVGLSAIAYLASVSRQITGPTGALVDDPTFVANFIGVAFDIQAGAAAGGGVGLGGALLGSTAFSSSVDLAANDFSYASVKQVGVVAGKASGGPLGFTAFESDLIIVSLRNGVEFSTSKTNTLKKKFSVFKLKPKDLKKLFKGEVKVTAVSVHMVGTVLVPAEGLGSHVPKPDDPKGRVLLARDVVRTTQVLFDYDSATLMGRDELELRLAVDRRLFTQGDGTAAASGFASPEGQPDYNMTLSKARALAVKQATLDAFGADLTLKNLDAEGFGEGPAINEGSLIDPPGKTSAEQKLVQQEALDDWPAWRKVELRVQGILVARVMGRAGGGPP